VDRDEEAAKRAAKSTERKSSDESERVPAANESRVMRDKPQTALAADVDRCKTGSRIVQGSRQSETLEKFNSYAGISWKNLN